MLNFSGAQENIVLVDDEKAELDAYSFLLQSMGVRNIITVDDSRNLSEVLDNHYPCIVFLDLNMPHKPGKEVLGEIRQTHPQTPVVICTANSDIEMAVECLKLGAHDYLVKPINMETFSSALRNALEISSLRNEVLNLKGVLFSKELNHPENFSHIITKNPGMIGLFRYIESISSSNQPVLILGETGSGKELFARAIHSVSGTDGEFVPIDVSGLDDTLFSDTLFGHTKGAYTGAEKSRPGMIEKAADGTLFLDEIGDLNKTSQVKLLRLLQEGIYYRLGDDQPRTCKARIITATNKTLGHLSGRDESFRIDLYYRLSTHLVQIPPLRERKEDLPLLVTYFADQAAKSMNKVIDTVNDSLLDCLENLPFPGNVRELKTYIYDAVAQCFSGDLSEKDIVARLNPVFQATTLHDNGDYHPAIEDVFGKFPTLSELTDHAIESALDATNNNQTRAAKMLGISKQALNKRLKKRQS